MMISGMPNLYIMWIQVKSETVTLVKSQIEKAFAHLEKYYLAAKIFVLSVRGFFKGPNNINIQAANGC